MAVSLSMKSVCSFAVRHYPRISRISPLQTCTRTLVQHRHPAASRRILEQVVGNHLCKASDCSRVGFYMSERGFFSKWSSSSSSSRVQEKQVDHSASPDSQQTAKDAGDRMRDPQQIQADPDEESIIPKTDEDGKPLSNWKRMKIMMKAYGYVIIPVHWVIAPVWFGAFYYTIKLGVDIGPLLRALSVSDHHIEYLQNSKASTALLAYALYKIFTPLRYTVTLGATEMTIRRLRRMGWIRPKPPKEKSYRDSLKETVGEMRDKVKDIRDSKNS